MLAPERTTARCCPPSVLCQRSPYRARYAAKTPSSTASSTDFHKGHEKLPLSGVPIYYRRCVACDFLFTDAFDRWSDEQFKTYIYNENYLEIDPDYMGPRPHANADALLRMWGKHKAEMGILDFGGGNDLFCTRLRANGFAVAVTYDLWCRRMRGVPTESSIW